MKYIYAQPAIERFEWELKGSIKSLTDLGVKKSDIILLFSSDIDRIPRSFREDGYTVFSYLDSREDNQKVYQPSIRPFLWYKFLEENPEMEKETFIYLDSDVVITSLDAFKVKVTKTTWFGSNTDSYLGYDYLRSVTQNKKVIKTMIEAHGDVSEKFVKETKAPGAQWVVKAPTAKYWKDVFEKSVAIFEATEPLETSLQKWTAEMWAQLWTMEKYGIKPKIDSHLDFLFATDKKNDNVFIIHNAGIDETMIKDGFFHKGYFTRYPSKKELTSNEKYAQSVYIDKVKSALY